MSAVWRASRAAVKRRRLQTIAIGLIVLCSTTVVLLALGLLDSAAAPFDRAFAAQDGAHAVATFDATKTTDEQLAQTAQRPGVQAAAGPFGQAVLEFSQEDLRGIAAGPLTVVGRADPAGPVDRLDLVAGRWTTGPGQIVINVNYASMSRDLLGSTLKADGAPSLTVVGFATSMSQSAGAWVAPEQITALHPTATQMLYRFTAAATDQQISTSLAEVTGGLPAGSLTGTQSYLTLKLAFSAKADDYLMILTVLGVLSLVVSILIVANVVSGAVVSGYRHIGVLKAVGFTPNQVVAVYLTMVCLPAVVGCVLGTLIGTQLARPILGVAFSGVQTGSATLGIGPWVPAVCLLAMPTLVAATALIPALRAHRLPAALAISAGSTPRTGRGLRIQRALAGTRLPRAISLGMGQPFARPGRTAMTIAAVVLGVTTVTLATGLTSTMIAYGNIGRTNAAVINVGVGTLDNRQTTPTLSDQQIETRLRTLPGTKQVTARALVQVHLAGFTQTTFANIYRGDTPPDFLSMIANGRWADGPGEVVAGPAFLTQHGLTVGDQITMALGGRQAPATIVGELFEANPRAISTNWQTLAPLTPDTKPIEYYVQLAPGTDTQAYLNAVTAADPGLHPTQVTKGSFATTTVVTISSVFTTLLAIVAALGVFNTVLLNTRERRRDLGMLKSIGMTPRQVITMTVASVAAPGAVGGLLGIPLGIVAHRLIVDNASFVIFPESMKDIWHAPQLAALALAGILIAVLGALIPARSAARLTIATVLHNE